jgi:predicted Rossmann fold nucleotide-binding protein DprA/Smf involved in DNA uptake
MILSILSQAPSASPVLPTTTARWSVLGEASDVQKSDQRKTIIEALRDGELSVTQLVAVTHMKRNNLEVLLHKMVKDGEVLRSPGKQGRYKLPSPPIRTISQ